MSDDYDRYSISERLQLLDSDPMKEGKNCLVWDADKREWTGFKGTLGEFSDSVPVTREEAEAFTKAGTIPERVSRHRELGWSTYEPWDD